MSTTPLKPIDSAPLIGTAPLNYCPECGSPLQQAAIPVRGGYVLHCKQCPKCYYLDNIQRVKTEE